jgi:hypothetical protein
MFFYTSCVVYIRSFTVFQAFYKGWKNHYPLDSAIRPSYNRPQSYLVTFVLWLRLNKLEIINLIH